MITGRWWKIDRVRFDFDISSWIIGIAWNWGYLRTVSLYFGPAAFTFQFERIISMGEEGKHDL